MYKKIVLVVILLTILSGCSHIEKNNAGNNNASSGSIYSTENLGRNPGTFIITSSGDTVFYKSFVQTSDGIVYHGLYSRNINGKDKRLLYNDFDQFLNYYDNFLYFTDSKSRLIELDLSTLKTSVLDGEKDDIVFNPLVINDVLYYYRINKEEQCTLIAYSIKAKTSTEVTNDVYWRYISNYKDSVCFVSKPKDVDSSRRNISTWDFDSKKIISHGSINMEMMQMLDDGSIIGCKNSCFIKSLNGTTETLVKTEDMYNAIFINNDLFICTLDKHGYIQIFKYSYLTGKLVVC